MTQKQRFVMGVDIGTSNMKCLIIGADGAILSSVTEELSAFSPAPGWMEQDPEQWYSAFRQLANSAMTSAGLQKSEVQCVGVTAATHTAVLLDKNNSVLRPAILWTDNRSVEEAKWLNDHYGDEIMAITYHRANPTWTLPQLLWIKRNEPGITARVGRLMFTKDYLRYRLTRSWCTDPIDAQGSLMTDAASGDWSPTLCNFINWPMHTLPPIQYPRHISGFITKEAARETGLAEGTPVVVGTSDTAAECLSAGAIRTGQGVIKLATAGNVSVMTDTPHPEPLIFTYRHVIPGLWYNVAATSSCAAVHRWLRDQFISVDHGKNGFELMDTMVDKIPPGSDGLLFHPYLSGERTPYWDPYLRGAFLGITLKHTREHFVRALYEGISFSLLDCLEALRRAGLKMDEIRIVGGGSKSSSWRQIVSNVLGAEVLKPAIEDAAFGIALVAAAGVGLYDNEKAAARACVRIVAKDRPLPEVHDRYKRLFEIYKDAQQKLVDINHRLYGFSSNIHPQKG